MRKLTAKQSLFVLAYLETGNASEAYRRSYRTENMLPNTIKRKAHELISGERGRGIVAATIAERQRANAERSAVTVASLTAELEEARQLALGGSQPQPAPAVSASMGKARLHGLDGVAAVADASALFLDVLREMTANRRRLKAGDDAKTIDHSVHDVGDAGGEADA
jgi:phage terminase small subunit